MGAWPVAISVLATQCSTNSILGAPAFVAFAAGGGLVWLQYELALPLAMIVLILVLMPVFRNLNLISIYGFLERRYDLRTRLLLSGLFLFIRAFATAVTVYSIAIVIDLITGIGFFWSVVLLGLFTVVYDVFGGIRGVIYSDVLQMTILIAVLLLVFYWLLQDAGGLGNLWHSFDPQRRQSLNFNHHGFGDGNTFGFWPMLIGGFFLYLAYYGCDQSQVQRELSTKSIAETNKALLINGFARFPLVVLYCFVGVGIAVYAGNHPEFLTLLPGFSNGDPDYNLAVPAYLINTLPTGLVGLAIVALFAAAMSSLDSVLNSLSATTMDDFIVRFKRSPLSPRQEIAYSRWVTTAWGCCTLSLAFYVEDIAPTVLEAINKIGSLANGSILAVFLLGVVTRSITGLGVCCGLILGIVVNAVLWQTAPDLSWLWWNPIGFLVTSLTAAFVSLALPEKKLSFTHSFLSQYLSQQPNRNWVLSTVSLSVWFLLLLALLFFLSR